MFDVTLGTYSCKKCWRSEEHTSELQSRSDLVCRLLLEKKKNNIKDWIISETHEDERTLRAIIATPRALSAHRYLAQPNIVERSGIDTQISLLLHSHMWR